MMHVRTPAQSDSAAIRKGGVDLAAALRGHFSWRLMGSPALEVGRDGLARRRVVPTFETDLGYFTYVGMVPSDRTQRPTRNLCVMPKGTALTSPTYRTYLMSVLAHGAGVLGGGVEVDRTYLLATGHRGFTSITWEMPNDDAPTFVAISSDTKGLL